MDLQASLSGLTAKEATRQLLGWELIRRVNGKELVGRIVETEAYHQDDPASHSYRGKTPRTEVMFGPSGYAYVYFTYGMHYCMNVVVGKPGYGAAVLIRALEPINGTDIMANNRKLRLTDAEHARMLCSGPAKLCQALAVDKELNGHNLAKEPLILRPAEPVTASQIVSTTRIGIKDNAHAKLRYYIRDNRYVSKQ